jgi:regulator of PEP synthase PpsR (kinase-PPPase family)
MGLPAIAPLDPVNHALSNLLGQEAKARPGRQHTLDAAYFARVDAIQFTIAHDDGLARRGLGGGGHRARRRFALVQDADLDLSGQPRLQDREHPDRGRIAAAAELFTSQHPLIVGLTTSADRLIQIRRNRLLSLNQATETSYVEQDAVSAKLAYARRMFADNGWPVIDVTRRSIEETAAAIIQLCNERTLEAGQ